MAKNKVAAHGLWFLPVSFFVAFYLAAIPMGRFEMARPDWIGMLVIFWTLALPERFGVFSAFCAGLLFDTLVGTTLGLYGFVYSLLAYLVLILYARIQMYPVLQQAALVFLLLALIHIVGQWMKVWFMSMVSGQLQIWPALTSALIWPWLYGLLRAIQLRIRIQ